MESLSNALEKYIAVRRAFGTQLREPAKTLAQFVRFLEREGSELITTELAIRWACQPVGVQRATWARRLSMVRLFATWLSTFDPRIEVPPKGILRSGRRRRKPHIFTDQEIEQLMAEAARLRSRRGLRSRTFVTLIGLLVSTGLRPGEALALDVSDVDLRDGILSIRQTKFGKSRFVPIDDSTRTALDLYSRYRDSVYASSSEAAFFLSELGARLHPCATQETFATISCAIGIRAPSGKNLRGRGPRLQDFRHTFATRRLVEWYRSGVDVERELPKLSTYLGHVEVGRTYWYIQAIPELLQLATEHISGQRGSAQP